MSLQNIILQSEVFDNASWTKVSMTVTANAGANPFDGTSTADAFVDSSDGGSTDHHIRQTVTQVVGQVYTFSVFAKATGTQWIALLPEAGGKTVFFDLTNGLIGTTSGTVIYSNIESWVSGWYRCSVTFLATVASTNSRIYSATSSSVTAYTGAATSRMLLWGAQQVKANWPGEYVATTTVTIGSTPPRNKVSPQFQNLLLQSQTLDNASLTKDGVTVSADSIAAPDGTTTADTIVETNAAGANHRTYQAITTTNGLTYTLSCYFKDNTRQYVVLLPQATSEATFDLVNGTVTSTTGVVSTKIEALASSWYRCSITYVAATSSFAQIWLANASGAHTTYNGDVTKSIYAWGFQLVQANWPGIYQVTTTATIGSSTPPRNIVTQNQNFALQSEDFSTSWTATNLSVTTNQVANPLTGTTTADAIVENGASAGHNLNQNVAGVTVGGLITFSIYLKASTRNWIALIVNSNASNNYCFFDLTNGVLGTKGSGISLATITAVTGQTGWYQCAVTSTQVITSTGCTLYIASADNSFTYAGVNANISIYAWGAQVVQSNWAGNYQVTTTAAVGTSTPPRKLSQIPINLVLQSEDLSNASWTKGTGITATANTSDVTDPLGTNTASKLVYDGSGGAGGIRLQQASVSTTNNAIGTPTSMGVWLRVSSGTRSMIINGNSTPASSAFTVSTTWQLFIVQLTTNVVANLFFNLLDGVGLNTGFTVYVWGVQVNKGLYLSKYVKTTTAAINGAVGSRGSLSQVQNLALQSEDFSNSFYTKTLCSITTDQIANPIDGASTADAFVDTVDVSGQHYMQMSSLSITLGNVYTLSVFAKAAAKSVIFLEGSTGGCYYDLTNGITGQPTAGALAYGITSYGNGWYRCHVTFLCTAVTTNFIQVAGAVGTLPYTGAANTAIYLWGFQVTQGYSNLSAYAQTTTAAVNTGGIRKN